jgi:T5orf172 domain
VNDYKRTYPRPGRRTVKGVFFDASALDLSLEATGLAAHIFAHDGDDIDEEFLRGMFPDRDLSGPIRELVSIGLIEWLDPNSLAVPVVEEAAEDTTQFKQTGTIYLVEGGGRFKIGISTSSAKTRLRGLQTGSPVRLQIIHSALVRDCCSAERLAHGLLARFRLHGEWFECSEEKALSVLKMVIEAVGER